MLGRGSAKLCGTRTSHDARRRKKKKECRATNCSIVATLQLAAAAEMQMISMQMATLDSCGANLRHHSFPLSPSLSLSSCVIYLPGLILVLAKNHLACSLSDV